MAYVDDLLVLGDNVATKQFLKQFQQHLELKHTTQLTRATPLEFLKQDNRVDGQWSNQPFLLDAVLQQALEGVQFWEVQAINSARQQAVGQLLWDLKNLKQLLRYIKDTIHYKLTLVPKATHNSKNERQVDIESFADSDCAGWNCTRKSTSGTITSCWGTVSRNTFASHQQDTVYNCSFLR
eukprot:3445038-Amphidinium_carterae.1